MYNTLPGHSCTFWANSLPRTPSRLAGLTAATARWQLQTHPNGPTARPSNPPFCCQLLEVGRRGLFGRVLSADRASPSSCGPVTGWMRRRGWGRDASADDGFAPMIRPETADRTVRKPPNPFRDDHATGSDPLRACSGLSCHLGHGRRHRCAKDLGLGPDVFCAEFGMRGERRVHPEEGS